MLVGGYSQDVSHVPDQIANLPKPTVVASHVVDRETLITFVEEAARAYREAVMSEGYSGLTGVVSRISSWNPHGNLPVCSVDELPGMTKQFKKRRGPVPSPLS